MKELKASTSRLLDPEVSARVAQRIFEVEAEMTPGNEWEPLKQMMRRAHHRGTDIRLTTGTAYQQSPDLVPYPAYMWLWREELSYEWRETQHINILEVTAFLSYLRHRARGSAKRSTRWLHVLDST